MTDPEWNQISEQLNPLIRQGFEAIISGQAIVSAPVGAMRGPDGTAIPLTMFLTVEAGAAILEGAASGFKKLAAILERQMKAAAEASLIVSPHDSKLKH